MENEPTEWDFGEAICQAIVGVGGDHPDMAVMLDGLAHFTASQIGDYSDEAVMGYVIKVLEYVKSFREIPDHMGTAQ